MLLLQDVLATRDRINTPGTVGPENWMIRLPAPPGELERDPRGARGARARERRGEKESMMARIREGFVQRTHGRGDLAQRSRGRGER
ncbi:hypothetical protein WMF31_41360 [Sorangium sp. So ce1036]|uniref:hypothetical protein n=1 Tax=Sorangium sp. So ce1036 TaxID=3133328 RepID=UPI003F050C7E